MFQRPRPACAAGLVKGMSICASLGWGCRGKRRLLPGVAWCNDPMGWGGRDGLPLPRQGAPGPLHPKPPLSCIARHDSPSAFHCVPSLVSACQRQPHATPLFLTPSHQDRFGVWYQFGVWYKQSTWDVLVGVISNCFAGVGVIAAYAGGTGGADGAKASLFELDAGGST